MRECGKKYTFPGEYPLRGICPVCIYSLDFPTDIRYNIGYYPGEECSIPVGKEVQAMQISKRFWIFPLFFSAVLWLSGCAQVNSAMIQAGFAPSPYYHLGDTQWDHGGVEEYWFNQIPSELNETYRELYSRLSNQEDEGELYAGVPTETFWTVYHAVLADHPEFFWIDSNIEVTESGLTGEVIAYKAASNLPVDQRESVRMQLEAAADECIRQIPQDASDYEKIKAVYEYLIDTVKYDVVHCNRCGYAALTRYYGVLAKPHKALLLEKIAENYNPILTFGEERINDVEKERDRFNELLSATIDDMFNPDIGFVPTEDRQRCRMCPYRLICSKN